MSLGTEILRAGRQHHWGTALLSFVVSELPNLLNGLQEGQEEQALEALAKLYRERRTEAMKDRRPEIEANRAAVDARLEERKLEAPAEPLPTSAKATEATRTTPRSR